MQPPALKLRRRLRQPVSAAALLRGDGAAIRIGARSNIQDGTVGHVDSDRLGAKGSHFGLNCFCRTVSYCNIKPTNYNRRAKLAGLHPWIAADANPIMARLDIGKNGSDIALTG